MSDSPGDTKQPEAAPESAPAAKRPLRVAPLVLVLVIVLVAVGLAVATHRGAFNGVAGAPQDRLAALETRVNQLAGQQASGGSPAGDTANFKDRIDTLESR